MFRVLLQARGASTWAGDRTRNIVQIIVPGSDGRAAAEPVAQPPHALPALRNGRPEPRLQRDLPVRKKQVSWNFWSAPASHYPGGIACNSISARRYLNQLTLWTKKRKTCSISPSPSSLS